MDFWGGHNSLLHGSAMSLGQGWVTSGTRDETDMRALISGT